MKKTSQLPKPAKPFRPYPLFMVAILALLAAMWAGLYRLGWQLPALQPTLPMAHGPLMVGGFMGVVISLERAVGLGKKWAYGAPILHSIGTLILLFGWETSVGALFIALGSVWLVAVLIQIARIHLALHSVTIAAGSVAFAVGNLLWFSGWLIPHVVAWWIGFLILTIVGERLELSRVVRLGRSAYGFFILGIGTLACALFATWINFEFAMRLLGFSMVVLSGWLLFFDVARRRVKAGGQARFIAITLLSGYLWMGISGLLMLWFAGMLAGPRYDAMLHTFFLGFSINMIFAHAPIVFPAVLKLNMRFSTRFYSHTLLLQLSLLLRIVGDLFLWQPGRLWGGMLNVVTIVLFLLNTLLSLKNRESSAS